MGSDLPGKPSERVSVVLSKVALRMVGGGDFADAISDLTGLGRPSIEKLVRAAEKDLSQHGATEFGDLRPEDRQWAEEVLTNSYIALAADPARPMMGDSLIGPETVERLAREAMTDADVREMDRVGDDARAYLTALSMAIAHLVSNWYSTNPDANRVAMSQVAGETLATVRGMPAVLEEIREALNATYLPVLRRLEHSELPVDTDAPMPDEERISFALRYDLALIDTDEEFSDAVKRASIAVIEGRRVNVDVTMPTLDAELAPLPDPILIAEYKRGRLRKAERIRLALSAFFSRQVDEYWSTYLGWLPDRVAVARAIIADPVTQGTKLDVHRTVAPQASAPIWLTADEVTAVLEYLQLEHMGFLRVGPGWRHAGDLPRSVLLEKAMPAILHEVVRHAETEGDDWLGDILFLPYWDLGEG
ncbi:hypothetical protein [Microbacterium paraoxydans]|uniref:hypothetical protein n=1 Tax=Microbacterium paraoxydans TaxID=199592 RepID=UPI0011A678FE|nr:hypothetical protein [Microbacterium paraoxydans]